MNKKNVSIICPVYNAEEFLEDCLQSVDNQTYKNYEMIAIDDGSTDKSLEILKAYAKTHDWLKVFSNTNHGQGYVRNKGLKKAVGKYILFLDSDDMLVENAITSFLKIIEKDKSDFVLGDWINYFNESKTYKNSQKKAFYKKNLYVDDDCMNILKLRPYYTVTSFYRKKYLLDNNIKYGEGYIYEDIIFWLKAVANAKKISLLDERIYVVRKNSSSTTLSNHLTNKHMLGFLKATEDCINFINSDNRNKDYTDLYVYLLNRFFIYHKNRTPNKYKNEFLKLFLINMKNVKYEGKLKYKYASIIRKYKVFENQRFVILKMLTIIYSIQSKLKKIKNKLKKKD